MIGLAINLHDMEAARALGFDFRDHKNARFASHLAPAAASIQAHARGRLARKRSFERQEKLRLRWIEFYLSSHKRRDAEALGWRSEATTRETTQLLAGERCKQASDASNVPVVPRKERIAYHRAGALDFPRFLAACHVALYHGYAALGRRDELSNFMKWGFAWVPFFFVLSGFVLCFSKNQAEQLSTRPALPFTFLSGGDAGSWLWKRWIGMYPLFMLSVIMGTWGVAKFAQPRGMWLTLILMLSMCQSLAWSLRCTEANAFCIYVAWNEPAWFVSALFFCWLTFPALYRCISRMGTVCSSLLAVALYCCSFWEFVVWRELEAAGTKPETVERIAAIVSRHPVANWYKFALGVVLARLVLLRCMRPASDGGVVPAFRPEYLPFVCRYGATPVSVTLLIFYHTVDPDVFLGRECTTLAIFSALIVSLAAGVDPLARLLELSVFAWLGRLSYAVYILHGPLLAYTSTMTMDEGWVRNDKLARSVFLPLVLLVSVLAHYGVEKPAVAYYRQPPLGCCMGTAPPPQSKQETASRLLGTRARTSDLTV